MRQLATPPPSSSLLNHALAYASMGWRVHPLRSGTKEPATAHAFKDATTDPATIRRWWGLWPGANIGIATGAPGPHLLDVDNVDAFPAELRAQLDGGPQAASGRGMHYYLCGKASGTVVLPYGELRGRGSYVVAPPSIHPTGKVYTWVLAPRLPLPPVPAGLGSTGTRAGCGQHEAPQVRVPHGKRHPYMLDFAVRLLRAGITDRRTIEVHLRCEFDRICEPLPPWQTGEIADLASWAAGSRMAERERNREELAALIRQCRKETR